MTSFVRAPERGFSIGGKITLGEPPVPPKRFLVFAGSHYYPAGGWDDFRGSADTKEDAVCAAEAMDEDWWHVIDMHVGQEIA